jgi:uncharacterized protein YbjT (DUF2867 family)
MNMNIVLGASGQVGSAIVSNLLHKGQTVKGIVRNEEKAAILKSKGADTAIADAHNLPALKAAFRNGSALFALTPETGKEKDVLGETNDILVNYRVAAEATGIQKIVALSSMGAQHSEGTGNLLMSHMLEHAFNGIGITRVFVRPAYYYSNWMNYLDLAKEQEILPTFFPVDMKVMMISPEDVAAFVAETMLGNDEDGTIYELAGPASYSSAEVAAVFSNVLGKEVKAQQIPREQWDATLARIGFSPDGVKNFIEMTQAVIDGKTGPEGQGTISAQKNTTLQEYVQKAAKAA